MKKRTSLLLSLLLMFCQVAIVAQAQNTQKNVASDVQTVTGTVLDEEGQPLPGATVVLKGLRTGVTTDENGKFSLQAKVGQVLQFSFVGMKAKEVTYRGKALNVTLESGEMLKDVVVTGIVTKNKQSFTGAASTITGTELREVGLQNPLQSLAALDPAFNILENDLFGSDPNHLPDINIRGKSSVIGQRDEAINDPNQPLFIVDGFESTLEAVYNLDLNRIESMTILKDAASTAIYGAKAANGVVVVETVKPKEGRLRLNYNGSLAVQAPDLSSYNLMNAEEKLEFEKLAGRYNTSSSNWSPTNEILYSNIYNERLAQIQSGVDTYWLSEPLRIGTTQKHQIYAEGGNGGFQFGLGANYSGQDGVMKQSKRNSYGGSIDLLYRVGKLQFQNKFNATYTDQGNPIVGFSTYANANPYYKKYDENGEISQWLQNDSFAVAANPLYNASLNSRDEASTLAISDYFQAEYRMIEQFRVRARFGITYSDAKGENFISPSDTRYANVEATRKGQFSSTDLSTTQWDGELTATYADVFGAHRIMAAIDGKISQAKSLSQGYSVVGFPEGDYSYPAFSNGYPEGGAPTYNESVSRATSLLGTINYSYDNRYLMDLNYTINGNSVFGANRRYKSTWAVGLGWNIMNETWFKENVEGVSMLKLRASIGNPGNQNFSSAMSLTTYRFLLSQANYFGAGTVISQLGNPNLKWQNTIDKNVGLDVTMLNDRLNLTADLYTKTTDPLLVSLSTLPSSGISSWYTNVGKQISNGFNMSASYYIIRDLSNRHTWSVRAMVRSEKLELDDIDGYLDDLNAYGKSRDTKRYYNGADPDAIWAVKSAGIDPATGRELFVTKDGKYTYDFSYDDEVIVGNTRPKAQGTFGTNYSYKGFSVSLTLAYKFGGKSFNSAIYNKVENITSSGLNYNQDKRALYDRWQKPGDVAQYKNIANSVSTPMSSRFVQKNNSLNLQTVNVGYDFYRYAKKLGVESLRLNAYMNDVFWLSNIRQERGTSYPFARSFTFALSFTL